MASGQTGSMNCNIPFRGNLVLRPGLICYYLVLFDIIWYLILIWYYLVFGIICYLVLIWYYLVFGIILYYLAFGIYLVLFSI